MADSLSSNDTQSTATSLGVLAFRNDGTYPVTSVNFFEFDSVGGTDHSDYFRFEPHRLNDFRVDVSMSNEPASGWAIVTVTAISGTKQDGQGFVFIETGRNGTKEEIELVDEMVDAQKQIFGDAMVVVDGKRAGSAFNKPVFEIFDPESPTDEVVLHFGGYRQDLKNLGQGDDSHVSVSYSFDITPKSGEGGGPAKPNLISGTAGKDTRTGTTGKDKLKLKGGGDIGKGGKGADTIDGGKGADKLLGQGGSDILIGGPGTDRLDGGAGKDVLRGGTGKDVLKGGGGADRFVFASARDTKVKKPDVILDFSRKQGDRIDLGKIDANADIAGNQDFSFIAASDFSATAGELGYRKKKGSTMIVGDVDGDGRADFAIRLDDRMDLQHSDFLL